MKTICISLMIILGWCSVHAGFDSLFVKIQGDTAAIWDKNAESNCASKFAFEVKISGDTIVILERDTSTNKARCMCLFDLSVAVVHLDSGKYVAMVYRQLLKAYEYPYDTTYFIGSITFVFPKISLLPYFSYKSYQSNCLGTPVSVARRNIAVPEAARVLNHPNPFNPSTNFRFAIPGYQFVTLAIYDLLGREVALLVNETLRSEEHSVQWDARGFPSGVYFYRLSIGGEYQTGTMILIR